MNEINHPLGIKQFVAYALPALPLALFAITFYVYLPKFYSDVVHLPLAFIGNIVLASRIFDAVLDPLIGYGSDRTQSKWGRRRPWMSLAVLPLGVCFLFLLWPALAGEQIPMSWWFAVWTFLFFIFWTMLAVPYEALGAEISFDYKQRNKLFGFREGALVLGTLLAAVIPWILQQSFPVFSDMQMYQVLGVSYGVILLLSTYWCVRNIQERSWRSEVRAHSSIRENLSNVFSNKPFLILLAAYTIAAFGGALPATLILFYVEHVLGSTDGSAFLVLYFLIGFLCLPAWVWLAGKIGKKEAWMLSMLINTGAFSGVFFLGAGQLWSYGLLVSISAIGYGATLAIPSSMQADVIDFDELQHGTRKEGQFVGFWSIAKKISAALGAGIAFHILSLAGYDATSPQQGEDALLALRILYAGVPCVCSFIGICIAWKYPIDQKMFERIRSEIDARG